MLLLLLPSLQPPPLYFSLFHSTSQLYNFNLHIKPNHKSIAYITTLPHHIPHITQHKTHEAPTLIPTTTLVIHISISHDIAPHNSTYPHLASAPPPKPHTQHSPPPTTTIAITHITITTTIPPFTSLTTSHTAQPHNNSTCLHRSTPPPLQCTGSMLHTHFCY